jgi:predicted permease
MVLHPDDRTPAIADLDEEYEAHAAGEGGRYAARWYRGQVRRSIGPALARRLRPHVRGPAFLTELRRAWRGVRTRPSGALLHVTLVALAVGASTIVFSAADAFVFRPSPYPHADRLIVFQRQSPVGLVDYLTRDELIAWRARTELFSRLLAHRMGAPARFIEHGLPSAVRTWEVPPGLFDVLGVPPAAGRPLTGADAEPGAEDVALVSHDLAARLFGAPAAALGQSVAIDDRPRRIVGVMPNGFRFPTALEGAWTPFREDRLGRLSSSGEVQGDSSQVIAVVAPGVSTATVELAVDAQETGAGPERARAVLLAQARKDPRAYTNSGAFDPDSFSPLFALLFGLAICLALITCLNIAGVEVASALRRTRAYVIQATLGASRGMLVRGVLLEGAMLSAAGALAGLALAIWGTAAIEAALPSPLGAILANPIDVDLRAGALMAGVTFGAWLLTSIPVVLRASGVDAADGLRRIAPATTASRAQVSARYLLMTGQVGLSCLLLVVAVLFARTYGALLTEDRGFDGTNLIGIQVSRTSLSTTDPGDVEPDILSRLQSHPAVLRVAAAGRLLPGGVRGGSASPVWLDGAAAPAGEAAVTVFGVDEDYFATIGMRLLAGRFPDAGDPPTRIVVDESFARRFWPDGDAVGARLSTGRRSSADVREIVGVAADVRIDASEAPLGGRFYVWHHVRQSERPTLTYVARLAGPAHLGDVVSLVRSVAQGYSVRVETMDERYAEAYGDTRLAAGIASGFGASAFLIAMVGLYGVTAFLVAGRTREIGIRLSLGATPGDIRRLVIRPATRFVALGLGAGIPAALLASRWIESVLAGVSSTEASTCAGVAAGLAAAALIATWRPVRQAAAVDPTVALRAE